MYIREEEESCIPALLNGTIVPNGRVDGARALTEHQPAVTANATPAGRSTVDSVYQTYKS